jgi:lipopolysaccharide export system permease protein
MIIKTLQYYLVSLFIKRVLISSLIFLSLIVILSVFEEISFFKNTKINFIIPYLVAFLNAPTNLFEIFPFIFLISTQFFFIYLIKKGELDFLKINGMSNFKIIKTLVLTSLILGLFVITFYYTLSSKLKFLYLDLKNTHSSDNKYLAVVTQNGLWIKDEINEYIYIINAKKIEKEFLKDVSIFQYNNDFNLIKTFLSSKVNISNNKWEIYTPTISIDNKNTFLEYNMSLLTHFDQKKINGLFTNLSSLNFIELISQKDEFKSLGYATKEIESHINRLISYPFFLSIMTALSSIIMLNIKRNRKNIYYLILGIMLSVLIYYLYYLFNLLGENGKIPLLLSTWFPLFILSIFVLMGLVKINDK